MERAAIFPSLNQNYLLLPSRASTLSPLLGTYRRLLPPSRALLFWCGVGGGAECDSRRITKKQTRFSAQEGTAVVVSPVGSITYKGKRVSYGEGSFGPVSKETTLF